MTVKKEAAAVGVDRGGTWTRVTALDRRLRPLRRTRLRTVPIRSLPKKLTEVTAGWPGAGSAPLVIATRGALSKPWKSSFLRKALKGRLNLRRVISDAEAAHRAAFGGGHGFLLIAGTGAIVLSGRPGAFRRTGGHNPGAGDPGSGRWLGRQYLKMRGRLREAGAMGHGRSASYAKKLLLLALGGHGHATRITSLAQQDLASLLEKAAARSRCRRIRVALAGGLIKNFHFRSGFMNAARRALKGRRIEFIEPPIPAEEAAARLALRAGKTS